jgi:hypothetical protein
MEKLSKVIWRALLFLVAMLFRKKTLATKSVETSRFAGEGTYPGTYD